ncbi:MAG: PEGA domain-containing protein [Spirochaetia bacterium]
MKSAVRRTGFVIVMLAMLAGPAFGQGFSHADGFFDFNGPVVVNGSMTFPVQLSPQGFPLNIRVAVPGARVFVDGTEVTGTVPLVTSGAHGVLVSAPGFADYNATINVLSPMSLDVALPPALSLLVNVNVPKASIAVDGAPIQGNVAYVSPGPHRLNVHADGYGDWNGMVNVQNSMAFSVRLDPAGFPLTVLVGAPGAIILVDGADVTGMNSRVAAGAHTIRVSAPGFRDYNSTISVNAPITLNVVLQSAGIPLTVNANVSGARVSINGAPMGPVPYTAYLSPGTYAVRVTADGYADYAANIPLNETANLDIRLSPSTSALTFVIPPPFRDPDTDPGDPRGQVRIFVDDRLANPDLETEGIPIAPGSHRIRIASGAFSVQLGDFVARPGQSYVIELSMDMTVRAIPSPR